MQGGAGGIGQAFATALLEAGAKGVGILDVAGHERVAEALGAKYGRGRVIAVRCDVTRLADVTAAYTRVRDQWGGLHIVINNAGIGAAMFEDAERMVAINLTGVVFGCKVAAELMADGGLVVNTASISGIVPVDFSPVYAATKAAVVHLTRSLKWMNNVHGIRVCALCPNFVDTAMTRRPEMEDIVRAQPGGMMTPDKVADALMLVLRDESLVGDAIIVTAHKGIRVHDFSGGGSKPKEQAFIGGPGGHKLTAKL
jgi:NAD(P)-dependent dehydrogenase (short-subunit alcohol dehydrogenase family)